MTNLSGISLCASGASIPLRQRAIRGKRRTLKKTAVGKTAGQKGKKLPAGMIKPKR